MSRHTIFKLCKVLFCLSRQVKSSHVCAVSSQQ